VLEFRIIVLIIIVVDHGWFIDESGQDSTVLFLRLVRRLQQLHELVQLVSLVRDC
jgi:hypothetical protein